ncbi:MAG TPA: lytic transglycosylase domain-containing protein [Chitinophagaceae bacterium]|nr:lytic transglycosylase domain-containing protein [Chitinophagaceae bacterium]
MLNRKLAKTGSVLLIFLILVIKLNAGFNNVILHDSILAPLTKNNSSLAPEIPLHHSMDIFVTDYAEANDKLFEKLKINKSNYFKTIDKIFAQYEIPVELKYLAIVESKLKTDARSGVGAVGVWQFMPATAKRFGLKITSKYDERQHLWKSSVAAAKYLDILYDFFGDWLLVVAAYNSGPGGVLNAIKKSGSRSFWKLQYFLPKETRLHVKRFIATHYYFEGGGSLVTLGKAESEKFLKEMEAFNSKNDPTEESEESTNPLASMSQWVAVVHHEENLKFILKK